MADDVDDEGQKNQKKTTKKWINGCHDYKIYRYYYVDICWIQTYNTKDRHIPNTRYINTDRLEYLL